jgi:hypothetical protein
MRLKNGSKEPALHLLYFFQLSHPLLSIYVSLIYGLGREDRKVFDLYPEGAEHSQWFIHVNLCTMCCLIHTKCDLCNTYALGDKSIIR